MSKRRDYDRRDHQSRDYDRRDHDRREPDGYEAARGFDGRFDAPPRSERFDFAGGPEVVDLGPDPQRVGGGVVALGWLLALGWLGGAGLFGYFIVGVAAIRALEPPVLVGLGLLLALPAFLILFAAGAAREGARGRTAAQRLAIAADHLLNPSPAAENAARRMGVSVRGEIAAFDRALDHVSQKLREIEQVVARQTLEVENASAAAQAGARQMVSGLERERGELYNVADELSRQAQLIGDAISRHTRMISDAARLAEAEVRAADETLESRLSSFGAAAALISDRTQALTSAAQTSAESALRLETALSTALDALSKATSLTDAARDSADAARDSADAATAAAGVTAETLRAATAKAFDDARKAAELVRAESHALGRESEATLERLKDAAEQARAAAEAARLAAAARAPEPTTAAPSRRIVHPQPFLGAPPEGQTVARQPNAAPRPGDQGFAESLGARPSAAPSPPKPPTASPDQARWTWREVLASIDEGAGDRRSPSAPSLAGGADSRPQTSPNRVFAFGTEGESPVGDRRNVPSAAPGAKLVDAAGLRLGEVFPSAALDRIAQKARGGTQARRRAVREAAGDAVLRLAQHIDRDPAARAAAAAFLKADGARISELLGRGRASMGADATRAFLLIDAAAG